MPVLSREPEVGDRLPVKEGASGQIVEQFANSRGNVQGFPGFVSMEVLSSEVGDEVLVITRWQDKARQGRLRLAGSQ
jgi:heme-degrading monooxygenase HmoA